MVQIYPCNPANVSSLVAATQLPDWDDEHKSKWNFYSYLYHLMPKQLKWWPYMDAPPLVFLNFNNGTHTCTCHWQTDGLLAFPSSILKTLEEGGYP